MSTNIEWAKNSDGTKGDTWNPISGCSRKSAGCENCYAEVMTKRLEKMGQAKYSGLLSERGKFNGVIKFDEKALLKPLSVKKPTTYFVNSMSDLWHENVKDEWIDKVFAVMALCPQHTFQILTKRPERMRDYFRSFYLPQAFFRGQQLSNRIAAELGEDKALQASNAGIVKGLPNVWLGVSCENQKAADERIPLLLETPAAIRFLSCEPLLEKLIIPEYSLSGQCGHPCDDYFEYGSCKCTNRGDWMAFINWVIVGGESGHGARQCDIAWLRSIVGQCKAANIPVFVKQLGSKSVINYYDDLREEYFANDEPWEPLNWNIDDGQPPLYAVVKFPKKDRKGGDLNEFPEDLRIREMPK